MPLSDFLPEADVHLSLRSATKAEVLPELVSYLRIGADPEHAILKMLEHREQAGSTGVGSGLAVPHCRTGLVPRLRIVFGRRRGGIEFQALDGHPVRYFFLLVAPPIEVSNDYLPVLGQIAGLARKPETLTRIGEVDTAADFLAALNAVKL